MRRRITLILLFPVFAVIFFVGWALYVAGDKRVNNDDVAAGKRSNCNKESSTNVSDVEMGLIEEILEEPVAD